MLWDLFSFSRWRLRFSARILIWACFLSSCIWWSIAICILDWINLVEERIRVCIVEVILRFMEVVSRSYVVIVDLLNLTDFFIILYGYLAGCSLGDEITATSFVLLRREKMRTAPNFQQQQKNIKFLYLSKTVHVFHQFARLCRSKCLNP